MNRTTTRLGPRGLLIIVFGFVAAAPLAAQPVGYNPAEFDDYLNFGYAGMGFERQLLTQRLLREVANELAGIRPHIYWLPLAARLEHEEYGQRYDDKLEVLREDELGGAFYAGNLGVPGFRVGLGVASASMPELRLFSENGRTYTVEFQSFHRGFEFGSDITQLRADLLLAEWIRVAYATYGADYTVTDASVDLNRWEETFITWEGATDGRYEGRIQEHEFRLGFDLTRSPLRGSLFDSLLRSIELAAMVGPDNVINGYGTYIEPPLAAIPFLVVGRNETFDYYYATGPVRLGILEGKYRLRTDLGMEEVEVGLNLWHAGGVLAGGYGLFDSPSIDDFRESGNGIWGFAGVTATFTPGSNEPAWGFGAELLNGSSRGGMVWDLMMVGDGLRGSAALYVNW